MFWNILLECILHHYDKNHYVKAALGHPVLLHEDNCCSVPFGLI